MRALLAACVPENASPAQPPRTARAIAVVLNRLRPPLDERAAYAALQVVQCAIFETNAAPDSAPRTAARVPAHVAASMRRVTEYAAAQAHLCAQRNVDTAANGGIHAQSDTSEATSAPPPVPWEALRRASGPVPGARLAEEAPRTVSDAAEEVPPAAIPTDEKFDAAQLARLDALATVCRERLALVRGLPAG